MVTGMVMKMKGIKVLTRTLSVVLCALFLLFSWYCVGSLIHAIRLLNTRFVVVNGGYTSEMGSISLADSLPHIFTLLLYVIAGLLAAVATVFSFMRSMSHVRLLRVLYGSATVCLAAGIVFFQIMKPMKEQLLVPEFMMWRYFSPFGLFGKDGINLSDRVIDVFPYIKYLFWGTLGMLSAALSFIWSAVRIRRSQSSADAQVK